MFDQVLFELGAQDVTLGRFVIALAVWAAFSALAWVTAAKVSKRLLWPGTSGGQTVKMLLHAFRFKWVLIGLLVALAIVGVRVLPVVGVLLALAAIAALSFRTTSEQIWAGLLILWERPFSLGERILVGEYEGEVERVGLRATTLRSEERMAIHVPNSYLTRHAIHNRSKTEGGFGLRIPVEVLTHCDSGEVISALRKAAERNNRVRSSPSPKAFMLGFTARGASYELRAWVDAYSDALWARNELCRAIQSEFLRAGIQTVAEKTGARAGAPGATRGRSRLSFDRDRDRDRDPMRGPDRDRDRDRDRDPMRGPERERDQDHSRGRDRDSEAAPGGRADRGRHGSSRDRDRGSRRERDSDPSRRRGRRPEQETPAIVETPAAMESSVPVAEAESYYSAPLPSMPEEVTPMPEVHEVAEEHAMSEPQHTPREEYYSSHQEISAPAEEMVPAPAQEAPTPEGPAPTFGRSKRKVPRR